VIAPAGPGAAVGCGEERVDLGVGEPGDGSPVVSFGGDGEHALDRGGVFGMAERGVAEQGVDGGEPPVAGADRVVPVDLEVVQERGDQRRVEIGDVHRGRRLARRGGGEADQQSERVAVAGDRVRRGAALRDEPVGEECLQHRGERGHGWPSSPGSSRAAASCMSSGTADKYQ
jgi:hypothetical protein